MIAFTRYTRREPLRVCSPYDEVVQRTVPDHLVEAHIRYEQLLDPPEGATVFEVRALGPLEERTLRAVMPRLPESVARRIAARAAGEAVDAPAAERDAEAMREDAWFGGQVLAVMLRAGLVAITSGAPEGWDPRATERLGTLRLWTEEAIGGLPEATVTWLGGLVARLTRPVDPEKKSGSGS